VRIRTCVTWFCVVVLSGFVMVGCSKKADKAAPAKTSPAGANAAVTVDAEKPMAEVQAQADKMSVTDLKATALQYQQALTAKGADLQKITAQVKQLPITEALGEKAKALKTEAEKLQSSTKALMERFQVYYNKLKEKGGDLSGLLSK
jgi:hypothetical protein